MFLPLIIFFLLLQISQTDVNKTTNPTMTYSNKSSNVEVSNPPAVNRLFMLSCLLGFPPVEISLQLVLIYILYFKHRQKYKSPFFNILSLLIIAATYWCSYLLFEGLCQLFGECPGPELLNLIMTPIAVYMYLVCMWGTFLVALNRFSAIFFFQSYEKIFTRNKTRLYLALSFISSIFLNLPNWMYKIKYEVSLGTWTYSIPPTEQQALYFKLIELVFAYSIHAAVFILYALSYIRYQTVTAVSAMQQKEFRLLVQGTMGSMACFIFLTFHHVWRVPMIEFIAVLLCVGMEPFVYLGFNADIRSDFLALVGKTTKLLRSSIHSSSRINPTNAYAPEQ